MQKFNIQNTGNIEQNYNLGLLPQRNNKNLFYSETSCRSNLSFLNLSSENKRIIRKTEKFSFKKIKLSDFSYNTKVQKQCYHWIKELGWDFPTSSIKNVFINHIFNYIYIWKNEIGEVIAYSICYFSKNISHIAYVFYDPEYSRTNIPIRLVLQTVIDSKELNLKYCYLGRFSKDGGFYKRTMPGFEYFSENKWIKYK